MTLTIQSISDEGTTDETASVKQKTLQPQSEPAVETVASTAKATGKDIGTKSSPAKPRSGSGKAKPPTKAEKIVKCLKRKRGATLADLMSATGWQAHSVRGFLSGTVRKKLGLCLLTEKGADCVLHYRIEG